MDTAKENKKTVRVAIVDDNAILRNLSAKKLENSGFAILFQADNGQDAIKKIVNNGLPDVCIVEENFATAKLLLEEYPNLHILMSSTADSEESVGGMLKIGVSGYVLKFADPDEITTAVRALSAGKKYFSAGVCGAAMEYFK
jgi:DNA-binding NarL/FixJ family response regulator